MTQLIKSMSFSGQGLFIVSPEQVACDNLMETTKKSSDHLEFKGIQNVTSICGDSLESRIGESMSRVGDTTVFQSKGNKMETLKNGDIKINGIRYAPYYHKKGRYSGKKIFLPEGFKISDENEALETEADIDVRKALERKEQLEEESKKKYKFDGQIPSVQMVYATGQASVHFDKATLAGKDFEIQLSGQSSVSVQDGSHMSGMLKVNSNGQSSFSGAIRTKRSKLTSNGQSSIKGVHSQEACDARSSGQSSINVTTDAAASISKEKNGQSSVRVTKI